MEEGLSLEGEVKRVGERERERGKRERERERMLCSTAQSRNCHNKILLYVNVIGHEILVALIFKLD